MPWWRTETAMFWTMCLAFEMADLVGEDGDDFVFAVCFSMRVSKRAMRLVFPKPAKKAFAFAERREPSITEISPTGNCALFRQGVWIADP